MRFRTNIFPRSELVSEIGTRKKGTTLSESRKMGVVQLTTVTAINMMGSGIILLPATLAEIGTVSIFAWILASIGATILAYAFAKCGMYSKKVGGMGGYAEYRFGRLGNFLSNYTYAISLIIANVAIATGVVSYGSYVFGFDLSPMEVCLATIGTLVVAASISLVGPKEIRQIHLFGHDLHSSSGHRPPSLRLVLFQPGHLCGCLEPHECLSISPCAIPSPSFSGHSSVSKQPAPIPISGKSLKNVPVAFWQER